MHKLFLILMSFVVITCVYAQADDLQTNRVEIQSQVNAFGVEEQIMLGNVLNSGDVAYENVQVYADIRNDDGEIIGEAFGFLVDQCGEAILDTALQPSQSRQFLATIDIFGEGDLIDFEVFPEGTEVEAEVSPDRDVSLAITQVAGGGSCTN